VFLFYAFWFILLCACSCTASSRDTHMQGEKPSIMKVLFRILFVHFFGFLLGSKPWAVGKRTPRVPVTYSFDKYSEEKYVSPIRQGLKVKADAVDDDVAHEIALALTEASQRGGSPQVSQTPKRKTKMPSHAQHDEQMVFHLFGDLYYFF